MKKHPLFDEGSVYHQLRKRYKQHEKIMKMVAYHEYCNNTVAAWHNKGWPICMLEACSTHVTMVNTPKSSISLISPCSLTCQYVRHGKQCRLLCATIDQIDYVYQHYLPLTNEAFSGNFDALVGCMLSPQMMQDSSMVGCLVRGREISGALSEWADADCDPDSDIITFTLADRLPKDLRMFVIIDME